MYKYVNAFTNRSGDSLPGYFARLYDSTGTEVDIFADNNGTPISTVSGVANAALSDENGMFRWYVANGTYDIKFYDANDTFVTSEAGVPMYDSGVVLDDLSSSTGGEMVGFIQSGTGAVGRNQTEKAREIVTPGDFTAGLVPALTAVRNNDDSSFSGAVNIPNGITDISTPIALPVSFARVLGNGGGTYRQTDAEPIFDGSGASHNGSSFDNFRTYAGTHVFDISTAGEIASNHYTNLQMVAFTGDGWKFTGGVTSCLFADTVLDASNGDHGIYSGGGINNDNYVDNVSFLNLTKPAVKFLNLAQGLWINRCRVEGNGQTGEAVFDLTGASAVRIANCWLEGHHEYLLKLSGSSNGGATLDGVIDIGAKDGVGFKASLFDVSSNLVIFGTNYWNNRTTAPLNCLVYGLNDNLALGASNVWEHKSGRGGKVHLKRRDRSVDGATFDLLTFTRTTASPNDFTNLQMITGVLTVSFAGADGGGVTRSISRSYPVQVIALGGGTVTVSVGTAFNIIENAGSVTITPQAKSGATTTAATLEVVLANVNAGLNSLIDATFEFNNNTNLATNPITVAAA